VRARGQRSSRDEPLTIERGSSVSLRVATATSRPEDTALPSADVISEPLHVAIAINAIGRE